MPIDFSPEPEVAELRDRTAAFIRDVVIPAEDFGGAARERPEQLRLELQAAAREAGLLAPHVSREWGGLGLDMRGQAVVFEAAGYSLLGPIALNCAAPDEGNMHLLEQVATPAQRHRWLGPLAAGELRSCFGMTEPAPGAGSDPTMLRTTATRIHGGWRIDGRKWFISGAAGAAFCICMARTGEVVDGREGATMFLVDAINPGYHVGREIPSLDEAFFGGHCEVELDDCRVSDDDVLGEVGRGYAYAQVRLAPARLTHCMRWLGIARRSHDIALDRARDREAFGRPLAEHGMVQQLVADSEIDLAASRALIWHAAWLLDRGEQARNETSIAKTFVAEAVGRVVDRSLQVCGSLGVSDDLPLARFLREVRPFRIYDGPSETHRWAIARRAFRRREAARNA